MSGGVARLHQTLEDASSVLLLAPTATEFDDHACADLLTRTTPTSTNVVGVTLAESPADRVDLWRREVGPDLPQRTVVVDGRVRPPTTDVETPPSVTVEVLGPGTEPIDVGMAVARYVGAWESTPESTTLCLHSLSTLLDSFDVDTVVSFVSGLNRLCETAGITSHHHLNSADADDETLATFRPLYDAVVEHLPDEGWTVTRAPADAETPSFRRSTPPPGGAAGTDPDRPETIPVPYSFDQILDLISVARRRTLLYHLKDQTTGRIPLEDVVDAVVARERSIPGRDAADPRDDVRVSLVHVHLPRLASLGIVDYDADDEVVEYHANPALESVLRYLETLELG